ncbi:hypothetical protein CYLTODRAFT_454261 [Cylindrobasidium torrendii FP15055 ss-10]|uniref:Uncharacterized protein n=1 Tax=Cylindrobasidium torrendii FP15055 ss-10 TaxID=1314674 RepID=A0A0D7BDP9_9AGAR|nr:hypothetical protein CYLTODRAFT_454261 [Cylindrobasidium torrendii FP15055 ss-10]
MAKINDLPLELLQYIFVLSCNNIPWVTYEIPSRKVPTQHKLLSVCRHWHDAATTTSNLWSYIIVNFIKGDPSHADGLLSLALKRSGNAPLDISISATGWNKLAKTLIPTSRRWRRLSLLTKGCKINSLANLQDRIPNLMFFDWMEPANIGSARDFRMLSKVFRNSPSLKQLRCNAGLHLVVSFPWSQLTHLTVFCFPGFGLAPFPRIREILAQVVPECISLEYIDLDGESSPGSIIHNANLKKLLPCRYQKHWLPYYKFPSLRKLDIDFGTIPRCEDFVQRSGCSLTTLTIRISKWPAALISSLYDLLPTLSSLECLTMDVTHPSLRLTGPVCWGMLDMFRPFTSAVPPTLREFHLRIEGHYRPCAEGCRDVLQVGMSVAGKVLGPRNSIQRATIMILAFYNGNARLVDRLTLDTAEMVEDNAREQGVDLRFTFGVMRENVMYRKIL